MDFSSIVKTLRKHYGSRRTLRLIGTPPLTVLESSLFTNREPPASRNPARHPFNRYMGYLVKTVVLLGAGAIVYFWLTAEVPGGEKRYEQFIRLAKERHSIEI